MDRIMFVVVLFGAILLALLAQKKDNKKLLVASILVFSLVSGLRSRSVGVDTAAYYNSFENQFPNTWEFPEIGFRCISNFLYTVFGNPTVLMVIYAIITNYLIIMRLWDFRKKCSFVTMVILYALIVFIPTLNVMRQYLAISILFFSTRLLDKRKILHYIIVVFACALIHQTSLLALLIPFVYVWSSLSAKTKIIIIAPASILAIYVLSLVFRFESNHIENYFSDGNKISNINITFIYRFVIFVVSYLMCGLWRKKKNCNDRFSIYSFLYFAGLSFSSMGMFYFVMARIGYYYLIFELLYWGRLSTLKNRAFYNTMIMAYALYIFGMEIIENGSLIFPYSIGV